MKQIFSISIVFCLFVYLSCNKSENNESSSLGQDSLSQNINAKSQEKEPTKIEVNFIWLNCYPKEKRFDGEKRLVQSKGEGGDYRTIIEKVKEYDLLGKHKAYAIFCTYSVDAAGKVYDSHASAANISIARFVWSIDKWELEKFIEDWKKDVGAWGAGPEWTFKTQEGREIFGMKWSYGNHGNFEEYNDFYDVETLEKVKLQKNNEANSSISVFWQSFQQAALSNNNQAMEEFYTFPFKQQWSNLEKKDMQGEFTLQDYLLPYIKRTKLPKLSTSNYSGYKDEYWVECGGPALYFAKVSGKWKFVGAVYGE